MKPNRLVQKSFAIILLLVFTQKIGLGLYFHDWFHVENCKHSLPQPAGKNIVSYSCNCIDDFAMPFTQEPEKVSQIISSIEFEFISSHKFLTPLSSTFFFSLRAPPSSS